MSGFLGSLRSVVAAVLGLAVLGLAALGVVAVPAHAGAQGSVTGRLLDVHDKPFVGAEVWLTDDACRPRCPSVVTDAAANYHFEGLVPGRRYCIAVDGPFDDARCFVAGEGERRLGDLRATPEGQAVLAGTVRDTGGRPIAGAFVEVDGDGPLTDDAGRYLIGGLFLGARIDVTVSRAGYLVTTVVTPLERGTTNRLDVVLKPQVDRPPKAAYTWSRRDGVLVVGGYANDDVGVKKVKVAVRRIRSGAWLRARGGWGAFELLAARVTDPGARRTDWKFKRKLRPGRYGVSLVAVDTAGQRNPQQRPWTVVRVTRR